MGGIFVGVQLGACRWMRVRCVGVCLPRVCWRLPRSRPRPRPAMPAYLGGFIPATVCASPATGGQPSALHFGGRRVRRLPCGARSRGPVAELAPFAALSFAQTAGDKSVHEARCARGPQALRSSAPKRRAAGCPPAAGLNTLLMPHGFSAFVQAKLDETSWSRSSLAPEGPICTCLLVLVDYQLALVEANCHRAR